MLKNFVWNVLQVSRGSSKIRAKSIKWLVLSLCLRTALLVKLTTTKQVSNIKTNQVELIKSEEWLWYVTGKFADQSQWRIWWFCALIKTMSLLKWIINISEESHCWLLKVSKFSSMITFSISSTEDEGTSEHGSIKTWTEFLQFETKSVLSLWSYSHKLKWL